MKFDKRQILRNVGSSWFALGVNVVSGIFLSPYILHRLGDTAFGLWILIFSITGYYGLFDLGRPKRVRLCVLIERGHREMPIEAQYVGRSVQTSDTEIIEVRLREIDKEERVVLVDRVE